MVRIARQAQSILKSSRRPKWASTRLIWLGAIFFLASAYFYQDPEWNGNSRLDLTRAIVEDRSVQIDRFVDDPEWGTGDRAFLEGHYYTDKAIGSSLLAVPVHFVERGLARVLGLALSSDLMKHVLTTTVISGTFTLCGLVMYLLAEKISGDRTQALVAALATAFGTMLWPYSAVFYGHVPAAAFLILALYLLYQIDDAGPAPSARLVAGAGFSASLALITEYTTGLIIAGMLLYGLYRLRKLNWRAIARAVLQAIVGGALPVLAVLVYNALAFGNPFVTGYAFEAESQFAAGMSQGFMGIHRPSLENIFHITLDPQFGLLWLSPVLLMGLIGGIAALIRRGHRAEVVLAAYAAGVMIAMNGGYYLWWGGSAFGPRLLIPMLPFLVIPIALVPRSWLWLTATLGILSTVQMFVPLLGEIQTTRLVYRAQKGLFYVRDAPFRAFSLLYGYSLPQILRQYNAGRSPWNLGTALGLPFWLSVPALLAAEIGLGLGFHKAARPDNSEG